MASQLWGNFIAQLQDTNATTDSISNSLIALLQDAPEMEENAFSAVRNMRPDIAAEVALLHKNANKKSESRG